MDEVKYTEQEIFVKGRVPVFLRDQMLSMSARSSEDEFLKEGDDEEVESIDWIKLAKGRHSARDKYLPRL